MWLRRGWFEDRRPLAAINGSFFTPKNQATALIVSDGSVSGTSYEAFGGMLWFPAWAGGFLLVPGSGTDGVI